MVKASRGGRPGGKAKKKTPPSANTSPEPPELPPLPPPKLDRCVRGFYKKASWKTSHVARPGDMVASGPIAVDDTRASQCDYKCLDKTVPFKFLKGLASDGFPVPPEVTPLLKKNVGEVVQVPGPTKHQKQKFYTLLDSCVPHPTSELDVMRASGGMSYDQKALRADTLNRLKQKYPAQWQIAMKDSRKSDAKSSTTSAKYLTPDLASGKRDKLEGNMRELVPGLPLHVGCMVVNMPTTIVDPLIGYYGNPKVQQTVLGGASFSPALPIAYSPRDEKIRAEFVDDLVAKKAFVVSAPAAAADADSLTEDEAVEDEAVEGSAAANLGGAAEVFKQIVLEASLTNPVLVKATVAHDVQGTGLRSTKVKGRRAMACVDDEAGTYTVVAAALKTLQDRLHLRKEEWTLKSFQDKWVEDLQRVFVDTPFSVEVKEAYDYLLNSWSIEAWFFRQAHTRYFFHHWYVLHNVQKPKVGVEFECHELLETCRSPYDCPTLTDSAAEAFNRLEYLARDVLEIIMSKKQPPTAHAMEATPAPPSRSMHSYKSRLFMFPGVLKSGNQNMHQRLHVDFGDVLGSELLEKVCTQNYAAIGIHEWLTYGYYIDMPLSAEGSWLRVAVPDPQKERFVMELVFIPFGSFVIRSAALFHSGHYGSPGNTRIHALMMLKGTKSDTRNIGYLNEEITDKESPVYNWALDWSDQAIRYDAHLDAKYVMYCFPNDLKASGIRYLQGIMANPSDRQLTHLWMLNPSKGLPPLLPPRKRAVYVENQKKRLQNSGKNSHSAVGEKKRKNQTEIDEQEQKLSGLQPDYSVLGPIIFADDDVGEIMDDSSGVVGDN